MSENVAILHITPQDMRRLHVPTKISTTAPIGHWEGDEWVIPEQRYPIKALLDALCLPPSWRLLEDTPFAVWTRPRVWGGAIEMFVLADSFPAVEECCEPPTITLRFSFVPVPAEDRMECVYEGLDLSDVEAYANQMTQRVE